MSQEVSNWSKQFDPSVLLYILTWKCASRHSGVQFFHIAISKSGPSMQCFVHFDFKKCFSLQRCAISPPHNFKKWSVPLSFCTFWLANVLLATAACNFSTSQLQKAVRACSVLYILTSKSASRYSGVQFLHLTTSKSGPYPSVFAHFDLQMCFPLQRRAIFAHRNFKKWSEHAVFCTFWLENVPLATAACNFSTSQIPKVVRECCVLPILTWKCASRYSGVQFFDIATSKSGPNLQCFVHFDLKMCFSLQRRAIFPHRNFHKWSENAVFCTFWLQNVLLATAACNFSFLLSTATSAPAALAKILFDPAPPQIIEKTAFRDVPNISRLWIFFLLTFVQLYLLSSDSTSLLCFFHLLTLLLCSAFSTVHIVGS